MIEPTEITSAKELNKEYNYKQIQIAFRFRQNGILLFNGDIFYTNLLYESNFNIFYLSMLFTIFLEPNIPLDLYALNISNKHRDEKGITLDDMNQYQMEFVAKVFILKEIRTRKSYLLVDSRTISLYTYFGYEMVGNIHRYQW